MNDDEVGEQLKKMSDLPPETPHSGFMLDYRSPQALQKYPRGGSVGKGFGAVWGTVGTAIALAAMSTANFIHIFVNTLIAGGVLSVIYGIFDSTKKRHFAFFSGILIGVSTVIGAAGLLVAVVCGAFK